MLRSAFPNGGNKCRHSGDATTTTVLEGTISPGVLGISEGGSFSGEFNAFDDSDWVKVTLTAGLTYHFYADATGPGSGGGDSVLSLHDSTGTVVANNDDGGPSNNSAITYTVATTGTYYIDIHQFGGYPGEYDLFATSYNDTTDHLLTSAADTYTGVTGDRILGGKGDDVIAIGDGHDALGQQGNDTITGNDGLNLISGGLGNDTIYGGGGSDLLWGDAGLDYISGDAGNDQIHGGAGGDYLLGGDDNDTIDGGSGADWIYGQAGDDILTGGADGDRLDGGDGVDTVSYANSSTSVTVSLNSQTGTGGDAQGDKIDISGIDANTSVAGDQAFNFIGSGAYTHHAGELHYAFSGGQTVIGGDTNGDGVSDFNIVLTTSVVLVAGDFVL